MLKMKKLLLLMFCTILLIGTVSAVWEWDNIKSYDRDSRTITIVNALGFGEDLQKARLVDNTYNCGVDCSANKQITLYKEGVLIQDLKFYRLFTDGSRELSEPRTYSLKYYADIGDTSYIDVRTLKNGTVIKKLQTVYNGKNLRWVDYELGTSVKAGTYQVRLEGTKKINKIYDWIITLQGRELTEWATWGNISLGDDAEVLLVSPLDNTTAQIGDTIWFNATANVTGGATLINMSLWFNTTGTWHRNETINMATGDTTQYNEAHGKVFDDNAVSGTVKTGFKITMTSDGYLNSITKDPDVDATKGYVTETDRAVIQTEDFVGDIATFDPPVQLNDTYTYWFLVDDNGATYNSDTSGEISGYPVSSTHFNWIGANLWYSETVQTARWLNIPSVNISNSTTSAPTFDAQNFSKVIYQDTDWNVEACDSDNACGFAVSNWSVLIAPVINVFSPTNTTYATSTIYFNATANKTIDTWVINYNGTNVTGFTINSTLEVEDGNNFNLLVYGNDSNGVSGLNDTIYFSVDSTSPVITTVSNLTNLTTKTLPTYSIWYFNTTDTNLDSCWYNNVTGGTNYSVTCNNELINTSWGAEGTKDIQYCANDTFGLETCNSSTITVFYYTENQIVEPVFVSEGQLITFTLFTNMTDIPTTSAIVSYNNTNYSDATRTQSTNYSKFVKTFTIPDGYGNTTGNNITGQWYYNISGIANDSAGIFNTTVYSVSFDDCSSLGTPILNYTLLDEESKGLSANDKFIEVHMNLTSFLNSSLTWTYSNTTNGFNLNSTRVCVPNGLLTTAEYNMDVTTRYQITGFVVEFNYIDDYNLTSTSQQNISLYDLNVSDSTSFLVEYQDENYLPVENAIIDLLRFYVSEGEYISVENGKTDENGQTVLHFVTEEVQYRAIVNLNGELVYTSPDFLALCQETPCQINFQKQDDVTDVFDFSEFSNLVYSLAFNDSTRNITLTYSTRDSSSATVLLNVTEWDAYLNNSVCSETSVSSGGTLVCNVPLTATNTTYYIKVTSNGAFVTQSSFNLNPNAFENFGYTGIILVGLLFLTLVLMAIPSGAIATLVFGVMGLVFASMLTLFAGGSLIGVGSAMMWLFIAIAIIIIKIANRTRHS